MTRWQVRVVKIRARDVRRGDVVSKDADGDHDWFVVHDSVTLPDGTINVLDRSNAKAFTAGPFDLVGLQTPAAIELPPDVTGSGTSSA